MKLELVSLQGIEFTGDVYEVVIPTAEGEISVFPDHMPLVSIAVPGVLRVRKKQSDPDSVMDTYASLGGVIEIGAEGVRMLVDDVEHADELYEQEIQKAYEQAQKMKSAAKNDMELEKAQALIDRHAVRLQVATLRRRKAK